MYTGCPHHTQPGVFSFSVVVPVRAWKTRPPPPASAKRRISRKAGRVKQIAAQAAGQAAVLQYRVCIGPLTGSKYALEYMYGFYWAGVIC